MSRLEGPNQIAELQREILEKRGKFGHEIAVCGGPGCRAIGCEEVFRALRDEFQRAGCGEDVHLKWTGCRGLCAGGTIVVIDPGGIFYQGVTPEDAREIVEETVLRGAVIERLLYVDPTSGEIARAQDEIPFYRGQTRLLLEQIAQLDPSNIEDYVAAGGYAALAKTLDRLQPAEVIEEIRISGLRGRGGGGFPTARKWTACREAASSDGTKYLICNADEGDPGAYMDRSILEGNPHSVIEGMLIGAYAVGANQGYVYVRHEYPLAVQSILTARDQAQARGLLGENILGTGFDFHIKVSRGGGAFVCGESTALIASLEGKIGEPRPKHVHTAVRGLFNKPTVLNNVETWANVPLIISRGGAWFAGIGTESSTGTKVFSLVGNIRNTGLVELPMGTPLRMIIESIGGGVPGGKKLKAVQSGGPSGGCLPADRIDLPVDFDRLAEAGSMMGSGGLIVMDDETCMVDFAKYFVEFLAEESCGKCVVCREGLDRMRDILTAITEGNGTPESIELLEELCEVMKDASLCALGATAPNPVLSTLRYFRDEYDAHVNGGRCPAGVCRALITFHIDAAACTGCGACARECPEGAISGEIGLAHSIDAEMCIQCGICRTTCRFDAVMTD